MRILEYFKEYIVLRIISVILCFVYQISSVLGISDSLEILLFCVLGFFCIELFCILMTFFIFGSGIFGFYIFYRFFAG